MNQTIEQNQPILLFDGVCNLCNSSVQALIKIDPKGIFKFTSLQSEQGQAILDKFHLPKEDFKTLVLVEGEKFYTRSDVALVVMKKLGGLWTVFYVFKVIPKPIRDFVYDLISKNLYRVFGKSESCLLPNPELRKRFL